MHSLTKFVKIRAALTAILFFAIAALYYGCSDSSGITDPTSGTGSGTPNTDMSAIKDNSSPVPEVNIHTAKVLIADIELTGPRGYKQLSVGPIIVDLNLVNSLTPITSGIIPEGTYDRIEFTIRPIKPEELTIDPAFFQPENGAHSSIVVAGTFQRNPFEYRTQLNHRLIADFPGGLIVSSSQKSNVTLKTNPSKWFKDEGGELLDPTVSSNASRIDQNIQSNLEIFIDNDRNGIADN